MVKTGFFRQVTLPICSGLERASIRKIVKRLGMDMAQCRK